MATRSPCGFVCRLLRGPGLVVLAGWVAVAAAPCLAGGEIRVVAYNTANNPDDATEEAWFRTIFGAIATEPVHGVARCPDILAVCETDTESCASLVALLNDLYGVTTYDAVTSSSVGGDRTAVLYDSGTVALLDAADLTGIGTHPMVRAHFRVLSSSAQDSELFVYAVHLKSGSTGSDEAARAMEAANLRADADALGEGARILFAGDFNLAGSSEEAWAQMVAAGAAQAVDPAASPGEWRDNEAFKWLHSQDPGSALDDRFDLQLVSWGLLDGRGLDYIPGSYRVFGNNGTHTLDDRISTGTGAPLDVLLALESASDHLPVVADYRVLEAWACVDDGNTTGVEDGSENRPFNTIQEGIEAAADGGIVRVARGAYRGTLTVNGKGVTIQGGYVGGTYPGGGDFVELSRDADPATNQTVIDGNGTPVGVACEGSAARGSVVAGLAFRNGGAIFRGGVVLKRVIAIRGSQ